MKIYCPACTVWSELDPIGIVIAPGEMPQYQCPVCDIKWRIEIEFFEENLECFKDEPSDGRRV